LTSRPGFEFSWNLCAGSDGGVLSVEDDILKPSVIAKAFDELGIVEPDLLCETSDCNAEENVNTDAGWASSVHVMQGWIHSVVDVCTAALVGDRANGVTHRELRRVQGDVLVHPLTQKQLLAIGVDLQVSHLKPARSAFMRWSG
jgi:hypothetical protein